MNEALSRLQHAAIAAGLPFDPAWRAPLGYLAECLAVAQRGTNLVGDASIEGLCEHVIEALAVAAATREALGRAPARVVDVGAGAGIEGLTLALVWPQSMVIAVEPRKKRAAFIEATAAAVGLANVQVRACTLHSACLAADFDLAVARAVWPPAEWLARAALLVGSGGVAALHGSAPANRWAASLTFSGWAVATTREVPGERRHAIAVLRATMP